MKYFVVIPAAGIGIRMGADIPKQYLKIYDKTVLEYSLANFLIDVRCEQIILALQPQDPYYAQLQIQCEKLKVVSGGIERCNSVLNGLHALNNCAGDADWVLVHDAARPCLLEKDINHLIFTLQNHPVGGLLGTPVRDTIKTVNQQNEVISTPERTALWHAFTPQMFRFKKLYTALQTAINGKQHVTDEASAIELAGEKPLMINGSPTNIKITHPNDLLIAENILSQ